MVEAQPTRNLDAYHAYLRGRYYTGQPHFTVDNWERAIRSYNRAVELDPGFVLAYAKLSEAHSKLYYYKVDLSDERRNMARAAMDEALGALFDELRRLGRWDDTLIVVTSDHGEYFGEHDLLEHSKDVYEPVLRVPLLIKFPGQREGRVEPGPVSLADLPRLLLGGLPEPTRGRLAAELPASGAGGGLTAGNYYSRSKDLFDSPWGDRFGRVRHVLYDGPWKFVASSDGADELYHLKRDPGELENLVAHEPQRAAAGGCDEPRAARRCGGGGRIRFRPASVTASPTAGSFAIP